jgi:hypothetical protein
MAVAACVWFGAAFSSPLSAAAHRTSEPHFHRDTYLAYEGSYSWWCGTFEYDEDGGYGNNWDERLDLPPLDFSGASYPMLTYAYRCDSEDGHDFTYVQAESNGVFVNLNSGHNGASAWYNIGTYGYILGPYDDPFVARFRFISDASGSDEDGGYSSVGGGFACDIIKVFDYFGGYVYFFDGEATECVPSRPPQPFEVHCGWEYGEEVLALGGEGSPPIITDNVPHPDPIHAGERSLMLVHNSPSGTPQAYVAWVTGLGTADVVEASVWRHDVTPDAPPSCRLWAHWNDSPDDIETYDGSAGGSEDEGLGLGWDQDSWFWVISEGHTGLVIEVLVFAELGDTVWIDDLRVTVPPHAVVYLPDSAMGVEDWEQGKQSSWGRIKSGFK